MAEQTTYGHSVVLEQYVNRKFKHHKTTSKVQRAKLVPLYVGVFQGVGGKSRCKQPCEEAMQGRPRRTHRCGRKADTHGDEIHVFSCTSGKLRKHTVSNGDQEGGRSSGSSPNWRLPWGSLHPSPSSDEAGCLTPLPGQKSKTILKTRILTLFNLDG